jgi:hypothetical protein
VPESGHAASCGLRIRPGEQVHTLETGTGFHDQSRVAGWLKAFVSEESLAAASRESVGTVRGSTAVAWADVGSGLVRLAVAERSLLLPDFVDPSADQADMGIPLLRWE